MMRAHNYEFNSHWELSSPIDQVWVAIADPRMWAKWWPGVIVIHVVPDTISSHHSTLCVWQTPFGYRMTVMLTVTNLEPSRLIEFSASGDLVGEGDCKLTPGHFTSVDIGWRVQTTKTWMNRLAWLLSPLYRANHASVMRRGEVGLRRWLISRAGTKYPSR